MQKDLEKIGWRDLNALITGDDRRTLSIVADVRTSLNAATGIVEYAKANAIDLIVTGSHGRGAVKHFLLGSVAERVVRMAPCPTLTVHASERDFIAPDAMSVCTIA